MTVVYQTLSDQILISHYDPTRWPNVSPAHLNLELSSSKCCHSMNYVRPNLSNVRLKGRFERTDVLWMKKNCFEHCRLWYTTQEIVHRNSSLVTEVILQWTASFTALAKPRRYRCWIKAVSDGLSTCIEGAVCCAERQWWLLRMLQPSLGSLNLFTKLSWSPTCKTIYLRCSNVEYTCSSIVILHRGSSWVLVFSLTTGL